MKKPDIYDCMRSRKRCRHKFAANVCKILRFRKSNTRYVLNSRTRRSLCWSFNEFSCNLHSTTGFHIVQSESKDGKTTETWADKVHRKIYDSCFWIIFRLEIIELTRHNYFTSNAQRTSSKSNSSIYIHNGFHLRTCIILRSVHSLYGKCRSTQEALFSACRCNYSTALKNHKLTRIRETDGKGISSYFRHDNSVDSRDPEMSAGS
ncbi:uncharacterized protein [Venturia canescens]|uniref:uncharacterized protein n=1 Tax=Venturia canescens TaxID=32260 RepID=UPI001C9BEB44|nr:uncharacterized protein LOC122419309 [Venturia canescens]